MKEMRISPIPGIRDGAQHYDGCSKREPSQEHFECLRLVESRQRGLAFADFARIAKARVPGCKEYSFDANGERIRL